MYLYTKFTKTKTKTRTKTKTKRGIKFEEDGDVSTISVVYEGVSAEGLTHKARLANGTKAVHDSV